MNYMRTRACAFWRVDTLSRLWEPYTIEFEIVNLNNVLLTAISGHFLLDVARYELRPSI